MAYDFTATKSINTKALATTPYTANIVDSDPVMEMPYSNNTSTYTAPTTGTSQTNSMPSGSCNCMNNNGGSKPTNWMNVLLFMVILVGAAVLTGYLIKKVK